MAVYLLFVKSQSGSSDCEWRGTSSMQKTNHLAENNKLQNKKLHKIRLKINLAKLILECYGIFRVGMGFKNIYYITYENIINNYLLT